MATKTARIARTYLPWPTRTAEVIDQGWEGDFEAVDALWNAYMALNAAGAHGLMVDDGPAAPMALTARAAVSALSRFPGVSTRDAKLIWHHMCDGASSCLYVYTMWRNGEI
jgi:hypothetical protein